MKRCVKCDGPIPAPVLGDQTDERCPLCGDEPPAVSEVARVMVERLREAAVSTAEQAEALSVDEMDEILVVAGWGRDEDEAWQMARLALVVEESLDDHMGGVRYPEVAWAVTEDVWRWLAQGDVPTDRLRFR